MPRKQGGGLIGMLGKGVGLAAEYREHRKGQKLSRENSEQSTEVSDGPSTRPQPQHSSASSSSDLPPSYSNVADQKTERSLGSGSVASDDKKAARAQYNDNSSSDEKLIEIENDEDVWQLDEAAEPTSPPSHEENEKEVAPVDDLVQQVVNKNKIALYKTPDFQRTPLPLPVILPQRRPGKKDRGFVRAYAPLLGECSAIDQETFLTFIENFEKASQASAVFPILQISAGIAGFAPSLIAMAVTTAVQIGAKAGEEVQSRYRTNTFLDQMNEALFKPAGLFAMIVKYKSDQEVSKDGNSMLARFGVSGEKVDVSTSQVIAKYDRTLSGERGMSDRMKNIRLASSETRGTAMIPEPAPLIFPELDKEIAKEGPETFKDKTKDAKTFIGNYMDRRAQMKYADNDPNSVLVVPEDQRAMMSKLSDPNHPMFNGGIIGFVSGGALSRGDGNQGGRQDERFDRKEDRRMAKEERRAGKNNRRYDDEDEYYGQRRQQFGYGGQRGMNDANYGRRSRGGLIGGLIGAATNAGQSREYEDSYNGRLAPAPYGSDESHKRRSWDERNYGNPPMPYGGQEMYGRRSFDGRSNAPAPPAPYGGEEQYDDRMPYGGQQYGGQDAYSRRWPSYQQDPYQEQQYTEHQPFQSADAGYAGYGGRDQYARNDRRSRGGKKERGGLIGGAKKMMGSNVLYLMIVNMPSEAELSEARNVLAEAKSGK